MAIALPTRWRRWPLAFKRLQRSGFMPRTLFGRSLLIVVLPVLLLQLILTNVFFNRHWDSVSNWLAAGVAGEVAAVVAQLEATTDPAAREEVLAQANRYFSFATSLEPGGSLGEQVDRRRFFGPAPLDALLAARLRESLGQPFRVDTTVDDGQRVAISVALDDGILHVVALRKRVDSSTTTLFMAWMVSTSALLVLISIYFLGRQVRPVRRLARAADSFGKGRDMGDVKLEGAIEIRQAALAFNRMRQRIIRHLSQRTEMLAAVSHDLSTPLTRMNLELELMRSGDVTAGDLDELRADVEEMRRLVDAYLDFARREGQEAMQRVKLSALLERLRVRAARHRQPLTVSLDEDGEVTVRPLAVERMLTNLVDNAAKLATAIQVRAWFDRDVVAIDVVDDGPGIRARDRGKVFEPFYRGDSARSLGTGGIGMGLTIARDVALAHGGSIRLGDSDLGGLAVTIRLPR
ncbi:MAG: ATP-binding protein [Pseudomonadota bacterium]